MKDQSKSDLINLIVDKPRWNLLGEALATLNFFHAAHPKLTKDQAKVYNDLVDELRARGEERGWHTK